MIITTLAAGLFQQQDAISSGNAHLLMIFIGVAAFALLAQALVMLGVALGAAKMQKDMVAYARAMNDKLEPLLNKTDNLVTDLGPQLKEITANMAVISRNVENISGLVREKINEVSPTITAANKTAMEANATMLEANAKARQQVMRVNGMVTSVLDATAQVGRAIQHGIDVPVREATALVDGMRAALSTFIRSAGKPKPRGYRGPIGTFESAGNYRSPSLPYRSENTNLEP